MSTPEEKLDALGIVLPPPMKPVATYVPFVITGHLLYVSGQVSATAEGRILGRLGDDMELSAGQHAARICGINLIAQCKSAVGELSRIKRVVKLGGFVNAAPHFVDIPQVINGCSRSKPQAKAKKVCHAAKSGKHPPHRARWTLQHWWMTLN